MKVEHEKELEQWLSEENLITIASYLEACEDMEMISSLWQIYNKEAIRVASQRLSTDKLDRINQWISQLERTS